MENRHAEAQRPGALLDSAIPLAKSRAFEHVKNRITLLNHIDV